MYGLVNRAIEELITTNFGAEVWERIRQRAQLDVDVFISNEPYPDHITYDLVSAAASETGLAAESLLIAFGEYWITHIAARSYQNLLAVGGSSLPEFLNNLPNLHTRILLIMPHLRPPTFAVEASSDHHIVLSYRSTRAGLTPFVIGLLQGLGKHFATPITIAQRPSAHPEATAFEVRW